MCQKLI
jgi:hypothetical protein